MKTLCFDRLTPQQNSNFETLTIDREPTTFEKAIVMVSGLVLHFATVGLGFGLTVVYPELVEKFNTEGSIAASVQGLFLGIGTGAGLD